MGVASRKILVSGGTSWYLWNFRRNLISALVGAGWKVVAVAPEDEHSARLAAMPDVEWADWPVALDGADPLAEFVSLARLSAIIRRAQPQFMLNHGIKANIYGGIACRLSAVPYASSVTGLGMKIGGGGIGAHALGRLYAFACNRAKAVFVQNEDDLAVLRRHGLRADIPAIRTLGSGVDLELFAFAAMPPPRPRTMLFVGRLQCDKGIWDFVEAARRLRAEFPDARFIAVGSSRHANRHAATENDLRVWKSEGIVEFMGHQEDVRPFLATAHALVLPSHGGEGVPKAILEAAASGRPSIASDVAGCSDAVLDGITGFIHPPRNVEALTDAMRRIIAASDEQLAEMARAARKDAEARFSDRQLVDATLGLLKARS